MARHSFKQILLFTLCCIHLFHSKGNISVNLGEINLENVSYDSIFRVIEKKANVNFSYFSEMLPDTSLIIKTGNITLNNFLEKIFYGTRIGFSFYTNQVILFEKGDLQLNIQLKGQILQQSDKLPVPYATVEIKGKYKGTITDKDGCFEMVIDNKYYKDSILFTSMGFESTVYAVGHFSKESFYKIYLKEKFFEIDPVDIYPDIIERMKTGNLGGIPKGSIYLDTHGQQTAIYIENKKNKEGLLAEASCYLSRKGNVTAPLRLHVYSVDTIAGKPSKEQLPQMVVVKPNTGKGWIHIDLSAFEIKIPPEGLFVAIEGVFPDDYSDFFNETGYDEKNNYNDEENLEDHMLDLISYGQRVGYNNKGKNETWHYSITRTWFKLDKKRFNVMMGAEVIYRQKRKDDKLNNYKDEDLF